MTMANNDESRQLSIILKVSEEDRDKCITLLQSGVDMQLAAGEPLGVFLERLPDFTPDYINDEVQTIFINGTALDDINTPLSEDTVIALSAAMPGLSGAIYRRNSIHASLRSVQHETAVTTEQKSITVKLKMFNAIARDRGPQLLQQGVTMKANRIRAFFAARPWLLERAQEVEINEKQVPDTEEFLQILETAEACRLTVIPESVTA